MVDLDEEIADTLEVKYGSFFGISKETLVTW
jgi:hypothetical protein